MTTDLTVTTTNPKLLDSIVQQLGPAAIIDGSFNGFTCTIRVFGNLGFIKYALEGQGYAKIVSERVVEED